MNWFDWFRSWLIHPLLRGVDLHDPRVTDLRREIIRSNSFVRRIYQEWYQALSAAIPEGSGGVLEIGSGAGFLRDFIPGLITSEVFYSPSVQVILDGNAIPLRANSLRGIAMNDVLHHVARPRQFFAEAARCLRTGGVLTVLEPWMTPWSRFVYRRLHHEPIYPEAAEWGFPSTGPLSGANIALPWIIFERDRNQFEKEFPYWKIEAIRLLMPFRYLVSGGVSLRPLAPRWSYPLWAGLERLFTPWLDKWAMFAQVTLRRIPVQEWSNV
jgi:SAM-dependent methyltransferase